MSHAAAILVALTCAVVSGCGERSAPPAPAASTTVAIQIPSVAPSASTTAPRFSVAPRYQVERVFDAGTVFFSVGLAIVACEDGCKVGADGPRIWLVTKEVTFEDSSLHPRMPALAGKRLRFWGSYPDKLYVVYELDEEHPRRDGALLYASEGASKYVKAEAPVGSELGRVSPNAFAPPYAPRRAEDEAVLAKYVFPARGSSIVLSGHDGPLLVVDDLNLSEWNGEAWISKPAAWSNLGEGSAVRLENGASFVISEGLHWISSRGEIAKVDLAIPIEKLELRGVKFEQVLEIEREVWVGAASASSSVLLKPEIPGETRRPR